MADAYSDIAQQSIEKKQLETQSKVNELQTRANTIQNIGSTVLSLAETGAKLAYNVYTENVNEDLRKCQNAYNEAEAKGTFDRVDMNDENSGVEADPEKTYQNRQKWLEDYISNPENNVKHADKLNKSFTEYLEGKKASIIESKNAQNYNSLKSTISNGIDYMNSAYFDPDSNDINLTIPNIFNDGSHTTVESLVNVSEYGIGDLTTNYLAEKQKYEAGEDNNYYKADYELRYALGAYSAGESEYAYNKRKASDFDSDYQNYQEGQWARAFGETLKERYLASGCDYSVISNDISGLEERITNEGITVGNTTLSAADLGTSGISNILTKAKNYVSTVCGIVDNEQATLWNTATEAWDKKYESGGMYYTSEEDVIKELTDSADGLNTEYVKKNLPETLKAQVKANKKNAEAASCFTTIIDTTASVDSRQKAIDKAITSGYLTLFSSEEGFGLNNLSDDTDNKSSAPYMMAYNRKIASGLTPEQAFMSLFGSSDVSSASTDSKKAQSDAQVEIALHAYNVNNSYDDVMSAVTSSIADGKSAVADDNEEVSSAMSKYSVSWDDYEALKTAAEAVESDPLLMKAINSVTGEDEEKQKEARKAVANSIVTTMLTSQLTGTGTATAAKNAQTILDGIRANVEYDNDMAYIDLGYIITNVKSPTNSSGYDDAMVSAAISETLYSCVGSDSKETYNNIVALLDDLDARLGTDSDEYGISAFRTHLAEYKDRIEDMSSEGFLNFLSPLREPVQLAAEQAYVSFDGSYTLKDISYSGEGYTGTNVKELIKLKGDAQNTYFSDEVCKSYYASGKYDFGKTCSSYTPSDDLISTGEVGSSNYYNMVGMLVLAGSQTERDRILTEDAPKCLTSEAIEKLKGLSSVNLTVNSIEGYESWNFQDKVFDVISSDSTFHELASNTHLSDWVEFIGNNKELSGEMATLVFAYKNGAITSDVFDSRLKDLVNNTAQSFILRYDSYKQTTDTNTFSYNGFNPITSTTDKNMDGVSYFSTWQGESNGIASKASCNDLATNLYMKKFVDGYDSEVATDLSGTLANPLDEKYVKPYTVLLAMETMGVGSNITMEDFETDYDSACNALFAEMQELEKADEYKYMILHKLTQKLDSNLSSVREYNELGYNYSHYTLDLSGNIIIPEVGTVTKNMNGDFIAVDSNGNQTNLSEYSGKTPLKERGDAILGEYYSGKTNLFGNKLYASEDSLMTTEGIAQIKSYNEEKSKTNAVTDYSKATEISGTLSTVATPNGDVRASFEELTGETYVEKYITCLIKGYGGDELLSQLSDGMREYVESTAYETLGDISIKLNSGKINIDELKRMFPTAGLAISNIKEVADEAYGKILSKSNGARYSSLIKTPVNSLRKFDTPDDNPLYDLTHDNNRVSKKVSSAVTNGVSQGAINQLNGQNK